MMYRMFLFLVFAVFTGCGKPANQPPVIAVAPQTPTAANDEVAAVRAKLSPEDRALVEAQEWCVVSNDERLGAMGTPLKLDIKGQPVFVCCKGCKRKAEADPDKTLAKLEELKTKKGMQPEVEKKSQVADPKHDHGVTAAKADGHDHGMGKGMGDPKMMQDMTWIRSLFAARDKITRKVTKLKDGIETVTESEDAKVAEQLREHVVAMYKRIEDGKPIMPMTHQPIFGELIKHAKQICFKSEKTEKGIRVSETSDDAYVVKLLQSHSELVDKFIKNGMEQMMTAHPVPKKDDANPTGKP